MMSKHLQAGLVTFSIILQSTFAQSQDNRARYPPCLKNSYFGVNAGYINYAFSQHQLEPGYKSESVHIPHMAVRVILYGYRFNKYLSAQISYMRPVGWIEYRNVNGSGSVHKVGMNVAGITIRPNIPVSKKFDINAEAGIGIITRGGFIINNFAVLKDASFISLLLAGGMEYHLNKNWDLSASFTWSPSNEKVKQPFTVFYSTGFNYTLRSLSNKKVEKNTSNGYIFPKKLLQIGYTSGAMGYGVNNLFSKTIPVFWGGDVYVKSGISLQYQRNIFHGRKVFSLDWGTTIGLWKSKKNKESFFSASLFPLFRFTVLRAKSVDLCFNYSLAGPAFISKAVIDGHDTGKQFTFQDFMGLGIFAGKKRLVFAEIRIAHYSNGNIYSHNDGVRIPLTIYLGYSFD